MFRGDTYAMHDAIMTFGTTVFQKGLNDFASARTLALYVNGKTLYLLYSKIRGTGDGTHNVRSFQPETK